MQLIPSIDLRRGEVVRLAQGRDAEATVYAADPLEVLATEQQEFEQPRPWHHGASV